MSLFHLRVYRLSSITIFAVMLIIQDCTYSENEHVLRINRNLP